MNLDLQQLNAITTGISRIEEKEDGIHFYRFTAEQEALYATYTPDYYAKAFATSGVCASFITNSESLTIDVSITGGSSRRYFSFDLLIDGELADTLQNFDETALPANYAKLPFPSGQFRKAFHLGKGRKHIQLYFPWSVAVALKAFILDDGACIEPVIPSKKLLAFGDSITQGYDALHPTSKYITRFARLLGAAEHNKAIGGEVFIPQLAAMKEDYEPDYILVSYGSNDWFKTQEQQLAENSFKFYHNLRMSYPNTPIFAVSPIWRANCDEPGKAGNFADVEKHIQNAINGLENVKLIPGFNLVPHDPACFGDLVLHPNNKGFDHYFNNLKKYI